MDMQEIKSDKDIKNLLLNRFHHSLKCSREEAEKQFEINKDFIMDKFIAVCVKSKENLGKGIIVRVDAKTSLTWVELKEHGVAMSSDAQGVNISTLKCTCDTFTYVLEPIGIPCWHIMALVFLTSGLKSNNIIKALNGKSGHTRGLTL